MTKQSRSNFTDAEISEAYRVAGGSHSAAAKYLSGLGRGDVSRQLARHWHSAIVAEAMEDLPVEADAELATTTASLHTARTGATVARRQVRALSGLVADSEYLGDALGKVVTHLNARRKLWWADQLDANELLGPLEGRGMTVEVLLSDLQIGKIVGEYNSTVAHRRLRAMCFNVLRQMAMKSKLGFRIERIVLAFVGDIIESDKKHSDSARGTDIGTAEQLYLAQRYLFEEIIEPLAGLGIRMDVVAVTGNHDHDGRGMMSFLPGRNHLSYGLYKGIELIAEKMGLSHVNFIIPTGTFTVLDIYGQLALYEHGVGVAVSEASMKQHKAKRAEQMGHHITYFRMGDKHTVSSFNAGQYVVNGSFFGTDVIGGEYSSAAGYCSIPAQWVGFHVQRQDRRFTLYDSFVIQLDNVR